MANALKMKGGEKFYRKNRETRSGNGFEVFRGSVGEAFEVATTVGCLELEKLCQTITTGFQNIMHWQQQHPLDVVNKPWGCG